MLHLLLLLAAAPVFAQSDTAARIDEILKPWDKPGTPGAAIAVIRDGKVVFEKGYGIANLEYDIPVTPKTIFHVASVSKQFTAMSLVLLEQDDKLSLEDDIRKYLPELPDYGQRIAIRNLLQHTSGIRDQWQTLQLAGWRMDDVITQDQILRMLFRQKELNFPPGSEHLYSNGGYTLAAEIVKRVSGKALPDFTAERIFQPLGMAHTHFHLDHREIVPNRAYSYQVAPGGGFRASPLSYANVGATSLFTTATDLVTWLDNFREPKVGGPKAIARLQEQAVLSDGKKIDYALGVVVGEYRGLRTVSHNGADAGYRSYAVWFPDDRLGVAVVSNLANFNTTNIGNRVAEVYLGSKMGPTRPPSATGGPPPPRQASDPGDLSAYLGVYWSEELETQYTMVLKDGKLTASHAHHGNIALTPFAKDDFRGGTPFMQEVKFLRDAAGRVTGLTVGGGRVKAVKFVRR